MSHSALTWLATVPNLSNAEFRVLYHLCNHHNDKTGLCFPPQSLLLERCGFSNGTLNNALNALEARGLVLRHRTRDAGHRKRPTRYEIVFTAGLPISSAVEMEKDNSTSNGLEMEGGETNSNGLEMERAKTISKKRAIPSPKKGENHLQPIGDKPVNKSKNNPQAHVPTREAAPASQPSVDDRARFWAKPIAEGKHVAPSAVSIALAGRMLEMGLVKPDQLRSSGIAF